MLAVPSRASLSEILGLDHFLQPHFLQDGHGSFCYRVVGSRLLAGELVEFPNGEFGMAQNLNEDTVSVVVLGTDR